MSGTDRAYGWRGRLRLGPKRSAECRAQRRRPRSARRARVLSLRSLCMWRACEPVSPFLLLVLPCNTGISDARA
eukprot:3890552-Rhodomonas_salina.2